METNDPRSFLSKVGFTEIQGVLREFVAGVEIKPLLNSAGGVEQSDTATSRFVIVVGDYHEDRVDLLKTFVHEVLHILLFIRFRITGQEDYHSEIRRISDQLAKLYKEELWQILAGYVPESTLTRTLSSPS